MDFKVQPLLPWMHSHNGPGIAVGDVNGDRLEDFFIEMLPERRVNYLFNKPMVPSLRYDSWYG